MVKNAIRRLEADALVCLNIDNEKIHIARIGFRSRYGSIVTSIEEWDCDDFKIPFKILTDCYFYITDIDAFKDLDLESLRNLIYKERMK
jgi:HKD family nuclease